MPYISSAHTALVRLAVDTVGDRGDGFGRGGRMSRGHFFMFPVLGLFLVVLLGVLLFVGTRRDWFGSRTRQQRQFDEWHRLAHAGPVPTGPSVMPMPAAPVAPVPPTPSAPHDTPLAPVAPVAPVAPTVVEPGAEPAGDQPG